MDNKWTVIITLFIGLLGSSISGYSQYFDYHREESPAISWNGVSLFDARLLATGGISLMSSAPFIAISNPALIFECNQVAIGTSFNLMSYQAYQYWGINEGVLKAPDGLSDTNLQISGFSVVLPLKTIHLSFGWVVSNILEFPDFDQDQYVWGYSGQFEGKEDRFFLATAFRLAKGFHLGIKFEYLKGKRQVILTEHFYYEGEYFSIIQQEEQHQSTAVYSSLGASLKISPSWTVGAVFSYQLFGEVDRRIIRRFENNFTSPDIFDQQSATDDLYKPSTIKVGATFIPIQKKQPQSEKKMTLAAEAFYVLWSRYKYEFFQELQERNMRDTLILSLGCEYACFGESFDYFFRAGYRLDPQPLTEPRTTLHSFSGGLGILWKKLQGDIGFAYFTGSAEDVRQNHFVFCTSLSYYFKGE